MVHSLCDLHLSSYRPNLPIAKVEIDNSLHFYNFKFSSRAYIYPTKTSTRQEEVAMKDFPLLTRVCIRPGFNMPALREAGITAWTATSLERVGTTVH